MKRSISEKTKTKKATYDTAYIKQMIRQKKIGFNISNKDDDELWDWISKQENQAQYIKNLIRNDMLKKITFDKD